MKLISDTWSMLGEPIYVGKRLRSNLIALTAVSLFTALLGLVLAVFDYAIGQYALLLPSVVTFLGGAGCAFLAGIRKNRRIAVLIPSVFCMVAFTYYFFSGAGEGTAVLWSFLLPIGISYFVSVKFGIVLSIYYTLLFSVVCYSPLKRIVADYYSDVFLVRLPLLFAGLAVFTAIAMIQYHRSVLIENEYAEKLAREVEKQTKVANERAERLERLNEDTVLTLAHVIDTKDRYTNGHSYRVSKYAVALAERMGWSEREVSELRQEALLHDIGKIGVPDQVLNKPDRLTAEEYEQIKAHTTIGGNILKRSNELLKASETARYHHERYDGRGYPAGLAGEDIPLHARVVSIADAYDAMHSDRIYRPGLSRARIRSELVNGRGSQFDPTLLDAFLELFDSGALE